MRRLELLNLALLAALLTLTVWAWPELPARLPTHFNLRGEPDAWSSGGAGPWFLLPTIAVLLTILMHVVARLVGKNPKYVNVPEKRLLLELPPEERQPILAEVQRFVLSVNAVVLLVFGAIQWATYRTALGQPAQPLLVLVMVVAMLVGPVLAIVITVRTTSAIRAAHRRSQLRGTLRSR